MRRAERRNSSWTHLLPGFVVGGIGVGVVNPALASTAVGVVPHNRSGMASGINNTFRQVGIATGIAAYGAIFQHEVSSRTLSRPLARAGSSQAVLHGTHGKLSEHVRLGQHRDRLARGLPPAAAHALVELPSTPPSPARSTTSS